MCLTYLNLYKIQFDFEKFVILAPCILDIFDKSNIYTIYQKKLPL